MSSITKPITREDFEHAIAELQHPNDGLTHELGRSLYEQIVSPHAGPRYPKEAEDLYDFITAACDKGCDNVAHELLALAVRNGPAMHSFRGYKPPYSDDLSVVFWRDNALALMRAIATYLIRDAAHAFAPDADQQAGAS